MSPSTRWSASVWLCALALGCGGNAPRPATFIGERPATDTRFVERERAPHTPAPSDGTPGNEGDGIALAAQGGEDQARATALSLVLALLEGDVATLNQLFAERVTLIVSGTIVARGELIERCVHEADALQYEPAARADAVVDVSTVEVRRAYDRLATRTLAPGIVAGDLLVTLPTARIPNARLLRRVACLSDVYVRPGTHSEIVGVAR
jgi:hypothetical protein